LKLDFKKPKINHSPYHKSLIHTVSASHHLRALHGPHSLMAQSSSCHAGLQIAQKKKSRNPDFIAISIFTWSLTISLSLTSFSNALAFAFAFALRVHL